MTQSLDQSKVAAVLAAVASKPEASHREIAELAGVAQSSVTKYLKRIEGGLRADVARRDKEIELPSLPAAHLSAQDIIARRKQQFRQLDSAMEARKLIPVRVKVDGPIGIVPFGDPHLDDDGTDICAIERDVMLVKNTKGAFAVNIGDGHNNWTGRLARLYAHQSTSEREAWELVKWFVNELPWLVFLDGNHGAWSGAGNPVQWMIENCTSLHDEVDVRIELAWRDGAKSRAYFRHNFPGSSQWNNTHGLAKAARLHGYDDPFLACGHLHTDGYQIVKNPNSKILSHLVRVSGYKKWDKYAKDNFFVDQRIGGGSGMAIIDPRFEMTHPRHVKWFFDIEEGADYLNFLRGRP